jgi:hypothetical protein
MDMTTLFDSVDQIVYADSCCHYNQAGNEIFALSIANEMLNILDNNLIVEDE